MNLRAVKLRDWKAYRQAQFAFPDPENGKNIILIGAPNGYGKTSFFEALTLGFFGREGLPLVPRATLPIVGEADTKLNISYKNFLTDAVHRRAIAQGRQSCSVELEFDDDGEPIILERRWHFATNGKHKQYDDFITIFEGINRRPIGPPVSSDDRAGWYRDYVARTFLPPYLAAFFLFDGEQVQRFARQDMAEQVRRSIEGLLGLSVLRSLKESLQRYSDNRRTQIGAPADSKIHAVRAEIEQLDEEVARQRREIQDIDKVLPRLKDERDQLSNELAAHGGGSVALVGELQRDEERFRAAAAGFMEHLMERLAGDVSIALAGTGLREATLSRLEAETKRKAWETGRDHGRANLQRFLADLDRRLENSEPRLQPDQRRNVRDAAGGAWDALWHPPPAGCADGYLHLALDDTTRGQAIARLETASRCSSGELRELLERWRQSNEEAEAKKRERLSIETFAPEAESKRARLEELSEELGRLGEKKRTAERVLNTAEGKLTDKRAEFGQLIAAKGRGEMPLRRANRAEEIALMIGELLEEAVPTQGKAVAEAMTRAWHAMARKKGLVDRIEIAGDCSVRLLNRRGEDLREMQLSAGEEQIFTLALIHAVAQVSERDFPFVVDTPLARLDEEHRLGVLRYFTNRPGQVILLSTDTEVVGPYLDAIRERILVTYRLSVRTEEGVTVASVEDGYFERV